MGMDILRLDREADWLHTATAILDAGGIVVYPTDTVYAIGGDALDEDVVTKVLDLKGRPADLSLLVGVGSVDDVSHVARLTPLARRLGARFLPGPLTLVLPALGTTPENLHGGRDTVGVRVPAQPHALELLGYFGPLTATSATLAGGPEPRTVAEARGQFGHGVDLYLDAGPLPGGVSTLVDATGPEARVIRGGAIPENDLVETHG